MTRHRQVVTIASSGHIKVQDQVIPELRPGQILVRVRASVLSTGTELTPFRGRERKPDQEEAYRPFGYQNAGEVEAIGEDCRHFAPGQRVACMGAGYAFHADYACIPQNLAAPLPENVTDEEGAFAALAATAMHAVRRGQVVFGEEVVVLGLGIVGQLIAQVCQATGAQVTAFDPLPLRVELAQQCGIRLAAAQTGETAIQHAAVTTEGKGMDCAFLCFGGDATGALKDLVRMMKEAPDTHRWGRIVIVGGAQVAHGFGAALGNLDLLSAARTGPGYHDELYEHGMDYPPVFVRWTTAAHLRLFVRWVSEGKLQLQKLITDRVPIAEAPATCYSLMDNPQDHLGVVITYPSTPESS